MLRLLPVLLAAAVFASCVPIRVADMAHPQVAAEVVVPEEQVAAGENRYLILVDGRMGFIDRFGEVVISPTFQNAGPFSEGLARVRVSGLWGYIRPDGSMAIPPEFVDASDFSAGLASVVVQEARPDIGSRQARHEDRLFRTYITAAGQPITESNLTETREFARVGDLQLAPAASVGRHRLIPMGLELLSFLSPTLQTRESWVVLEGTGQVAFSVHGAERVLAFSDGLAAFRQKPGWLRPRSRWGYLDAAGSVAIEPRFQAAAGFSEGLAAVVLNDRYGYVDVAGELAIPPRFENAGPFREGRARVQVDGTWGFIDRSGALVIEPRFSFASDFSDGLAAVQAEGRYGFISPDGAVAIPFDFELARPFRHGLAYVRSGDREGYVDEEGRWVWSKGIRDEG
jgi:hypothetical protein